MTDIQITEPLPLSPRIISMYRALLPKDRKEVKESYMNRFGVKDKVFQNLFGNPDEFKPSLEERTLLTEEVTRRYYASTNPEEFEKIIEEKVKASLTYIEPLTEEQLLYQKWKKGELGKNATAKQSY